MNALTLSILVFISVSAKQLPSFIERCSLSDPKLAECMSRAYPKVAVKLKDGNREMGLAPSDPLVVPKIDLRQSGGSSFSIRQIIENVKIYGLPYSKLEDMKLSLLDDNCFWNFKSFSETSRLEGDYQMTGKLLLFTINGHGKCNNTFYDGVATFDLKCEKYSKNGKKYIRITDVAYTFTPKKVVFYFENLVDGNELLSKEVLKTMNENAADVFNELAGGFEDAMGQIWKNILNNVFAKVSEDELFLP